MAKDLTPIRTEPKKAPNLKYQRDKDREMVRGIFRFHEVPGGSMSFCIKLYREDEVERFDMLDGEIYTVPRGVARHLNNNLWYPEYEFIQGEDVRSIQRIGKKVQRCSFQSLEFVEDMDMMPSKPVITVENINKGI